ncbi:hypothetical protein CEXT_293761 [Caerostris extrusa]|uniref:Uncharacterized protein n=1 Tax=Caerostris extrusa TaxID=172846 RepID=A0AAV4Y5F3_CAEEX|nr:hypothetical protein CEXT_293761 [Caerostris extrusa]
MREYASPKVACKYIRCITIPRLDIQIRTGLRFHFRPKSLEAYTFAMQNAVSQQNKYVKIKGWTASGG